MLASELKSVYFAFDVNDSVSMRDDHGSIETQQCWFLFFGGVAGLYHVSKEGVVSKDVY